MMYDVMMYDVMMYDVMMYDVMMFYSLLTTHPRHVGVLLPTSKNSS